MTFFDRIIGKRHYSDPPALQEAQAEHYDLTVTMSREFKKRYTDLGKGAARAFSDRLDLQGEKE